MQLLRIIVCPESLLRPACIIPKCIPCARRGESVQKAAKAQRHRRVSAIVPVTGDEWTRRPNTAPPLQASITPCIMWCVNCKQGSMPGGHYDQAGHQHQELSPESSSSQSTRVPLEGEILKPQVNCLEWHIRPVDSFFCHDVDGTGDWQCPCQWVGTLAAVTLTADFAYRMLACSVH